jgi:glycosyltransferase involved in cell wall biosynthesis
VAAELPLVSIVTPSLNQARYVEEAIRSVSEQDYPSIEHVVVDGGSTDGTLDVLERHAHLRWVSEPDDGQAAAIAKGFGMTSGEILAWLNADDLYLPGAVSRAVAAMRAHGAHVVYGGWRQIDEAGRLIKDVSARPFDYRELLSERNTIAQPSVFFSREAYESVGGLDTSYRYAMDYELWLRLGARYDFLRVDAILSAFRLHEASKTVSEYARFWPETHRASRRHGGAYFSPMWRRTFPLRHPSVLRLVLGWRMLRQGDLGGLAAAAARSAGRRAARRLPSKR